MGVHKRDLLNVVLFLVALGIVVSGIMVSQARGPARTVPSAEAQPAEPSHHQAAPAPAPARSEAAAGRGAEERSLAPVPGAPDPAAVTQAPPAGQPGPRSQDAVPPAPAAAVGSASSPSGPRPVPVRASTSHLVGAPSSGRLAPISVRAGDRPRGSLPPFLPPLYGPEFSSPPPAPEVLRLTGLVRGEQRVAVLRRGERRYLVREGDTVEGSYRVSQITANSVVLRRGARKRVLRLGQP